MAAQPQPVVRPRDLAMLIKAVRLPQWDDIKYKGQQNVLARDGSSTIGRELFLNALLAASGLSAAAPQLALHDAGVQSQVLGLGSSKERVKLRHWYRGRHLSKPPGLQPGGYARPFFEGALVYAGGSSQVHVRLRHNATSPVLCDQNGGELGDVTDLVWAGAAPPPPIDQLLVAPAGQGAAPPPLLPAPGGADIPMPVVMAQPMAQPMPQQVPDIAPPDREAAGSLLALCEGVGLQPVLWSQSCAASPVE